MPTCTLEMLLSLLFALEDWRGNASLAQMGVRIGHGGAYTERRSLRTPYKTFPFARLFVLT